MTKKMILCYYVILYFPIPVISANELLQGNSFEWKKPGKVYYLEYFCSQKNMVKQALQTFLPSPKTVLQVGTGISVDLLLKQSFSLL